MPSKRNNSTVRFGDGVPRLIRMLSGLGLEQARRLVWMVQLPSSSRDAPPEAPDASSGKTAADNLGPEDYGIIDGGGGHIAIDRSVKARRP
jgi:hypothetical protein